MKLITIKPIIYEADGDDVFANQALPTDATELFNHLERKEAAIAHMKRQFDGVANDIAHNIPGNHRRNPFQVSDPRQRAIDKDVASGKLIQLGRWMVVPNTPANHPLIKKALDAENRFNQLDTAYTKIHKQVLKVKKEALAQKMTIRQGDVTKEQIPKAQIPKKLGSGRLAFDNPYFMGDNEYAGDPAFYSWTPQMLITYNEIDDILTSRGLERFTTMYASTIYRTERSVKRSLPNFALLGANGKIIWRKSDWGGASSKNIVYVGSTKIYVSRFIHLDKNDPNELDKILAGVKK